MTRCMTPPGESRWYPPTRNKSPVFHLPYEIHRWKPGLLVRADNYRPMAAFRDPPADYPFFPAIKGTERFVKNEKVRITRQDTTEVETFQLTS